MPEGPLIGRRIAVTRPREQAATLADGLERLGAEVSIVPLVEIRATKDKRALDAAVDAPEGYDWVVFTSANGVAAIGDRLRGPLARARVAAVGPATAEAVRACGVEPAFVPDRFASDAVAAGLGSLAGARVLLPQSDIAETMLAEELRAGGATVNAIEAYRTVPVVPAMAGILPLRLADAIIVASRSAVRSLASLAETVDGLRDPLLVCIGPRTAAAARDVAMPVGLIAHESTTEGIIQALVTHFQHRL